MATPPAPAGEQAPDAKGPGDVVARVADFTELAASPPATGPASLDRVMDVTVQATVELGRTHLTIGEVLKLGVGSVVELERAVAEPVDLLVQGVRLARGEVVVVDDRFAIRIKEIAEPKRKS
jgi:flagellar motor switch protein FliN/FliY